MSLREEMWRYEKLTGESAEHIPIIRLGAFLDGVDKGIEELKKIKEEIQKENNYNPEIKQTEYMCGTNQAYKNAISIIDKHISELKGENK